MHVLATAGHVDHGKSALVRALTGTEPDRWAEERRRGMTLDLGYAWTEIGGQTLAFVDVPGHERFVPTMLAGLGPVPAVLLVVSADEGWMPQTGEHVAAADAWGVTRAVVAVSRSDLADPAPVVADVTSRLTRTRIRPSAVVAVSARTGAGLDELRAALARLAESMPPSDVDAPVRLWVDRSFTIRGAGTVVTGTLPAGTVRTGDVLELGSRSVRVRSVQSLGEPVDRVTAVARVALNLRGVGPDDVRRGDALVTPGAWRSTDTLDAALGSAATEVPERLMLHAGSAAVPVHVRRLGPGTVRVRLATPLPLTRGDRLLLRDPGRHHVVSGLEVLDPDPPPLTRRGAAARRDRDLLDDDAAGAADRRRHADQQARLVALVTRHAQVRPLEPGPTAAAAARELGLPVAELVGLVVAPLTLTAGRVVDTGRPVLPQAVADAVAEVRADLAAAPFAAPDADRLAGLHLGPRELAAAERVGALLRVTDTVVLRPDAVAEASARLAGLGAPFSVSEARAALGTTRRVAVPLLELLDRRGLTARGPDDRRVVVGSPDG